MIVTEEITITGKLVVATRPGAYLYVELLWLNPDLTIYTLSTTSDLNGDFIFKYAPTQIGGAQWLCTSEGVSTPYNTIDVIKPATSPFVTAPPTIHNTPTSNNEDFNDSIIITTAIIVVVSSFIILFVLTLVVVFRVRRKSSTVYP
jgi:hypothetical protein